VERKIYKKLIRDLIPEIIAEKGKKSKTSELSDEKFITYLKKKIVEEAQELLEAKIKEEVADEIADILELIDYIEKEHGLTRKEILKLKEKKKKERGGFDKKLFLEYVEE